MMESLSDLLCACVCLSGYVCLCVHVCVCVCALDIYMHEPVSGLCSITSLPLQINHIPQVGYFHS